MNTVFIGGSREIRTLPPRVAERIDAIVAAQLQVLIGDADGFDTLVQSHLASRAYKHVLVYCTNGKCRNNVGSWPLRSVPFVGAPGTRAFFTAKDDAMLEDARFGFFGWNASSAGTRRNILRMAQRGLPSVVYIAANDAFVTVRSEADINSLTQGGDSRSVASSELALF